MLKVLTAESSFDSAKLLRDHLQPKWGKRILVTKNPEKITTSPFIRYGNSSPVNVEETDFNSPDFIKFSANKQKFSMKMEEHEIYSPQYFKGNSNLIFPMLIRETLTSYGCKGIHVIESSGDFNKTYRASYFWTPYIYLEFELRVHVLGGKIARVFKKTMENEPKLPIRKNSNCHFSLRDVGKYPKLDKCVEELMEVPQISDGRFFSIDIGWDKDNQEYFVLELNSGSGLNDNTAEEYATYIYETYLI